MDVRQEIESFGIGLKIPSQRIVRGVVGGTWVEVVEGKVLVLGEGLGRDDVGGLKDAGVAFLFGVNPVSPNGFVAVKCYGIETLVQ
jgi:hypothetical protein